MSGEEVAWVLLGIGLNVHKGALPEGAAALEEFLEVSRVRVLARLLECLGPAMPSLPTPRRCCGTTAPTATPWAGGCG